MAAEERTVHSVDKAMEIAKSSPDYFVPQQFQNPANPRMHYRTTAVELVEQLVERGDLMPRSVFDYIKYLLETHLTF